MSGKITYYFRVKGDELHKENKSHMRKDRWMSETVNTIYSDVKSMFEISVIFRYLQSQNLQTVTEFIGL